MAGGGSAGGNFMLTAIAGWHGSVEVSKRKGKVKSTISSLTAYQLSPVMVEKPRRTP